MRHHLKSEFVFLPSDTKIKVFFVMFSAVVMFRSHAEAGMSVPPLTTASTEHKLSLFAITITFCLHVKHEPVDWTSSCPSSRGRSSHSGKYGEIAVGAGGDEACKGGKSEYTVKVNYDTIKELTVRSQQHALMKYNTATLSIYSKCLHMDTGWQISWDANLSETQSFFFFFFFPASSYCRFYFKCTLFHFPLCVLFRRQWSDCISMRSRLGRLTLWGVSSAETTAKKKKKKNPHCTTSPPS